MVVASATVALSAVLFVARAIRRSFQRKITSKLKCPCGKIEGTIVAKKEDSARIYCYCGDCRKYASYIAALGDHEETTVGKEFGDTRVVQVCKSGVTITKGQEFLKLAVKKKQKGPNQVFMHRYYASCCHVPLMNTVSFLGFVGVFTDFLDDNCQQFAEPVRMFPDEGFGQPTPPLPDVSAPAFMWKLLRYIPWTKAGPFDYNATPVYWGEDTLEDGDSKEG